MDTKQLLSRFTSLLEYKGYQVNGEALTTYRDSMSFSCRLSGDDLPERYHSAHGNDLQELEKDFNRDFAEMPSAAEVRDAKFTELALILARQAKERGYAEIVVRQLTELSKALSENILTDQRQRPHSAFDEDEPAPEWDADAAYLE